MPRMTSMLLALAFATACGGGQKSTAPAQAGRSGAAQSTPAANTSGEPDWVNRGSAAVSGDGGRLFYGVGMATGIKNPALLRSSADNRARAELGKVFETFSASLMKDYSNSDGAQNVEQAVKTLSSMSLEGVQIVDRYSGADGALYALAALDIEKVQGAIAKAKASGLVKSSTEPVNVNDMFDKSAKKESTPQVVAQASTDATGPSTVPAHADSSGAQTRTGAKPAWVDGADPRFPSSTYLCAVGLAGDRSAAESAGLAALSRYFSAKVASSSKDFMGAYSKTGAPDLEVQSTENVTRVSTEAVLQGVAIKEIWADGASQYALACLERSKTAQLLHAQIDDGDQKAGSYLANAGKMDQAGKIRELSRAMDVILQREAANTQLRLVDLHGVGVSSPYAPVDVSSALEAAVEALKVGVRTAGPYDADFRGALIQGLTTRGYRVTDLSQAMEGDMDVLVSANIRVEDGGAGTGSASSTFFARGVIQVEVKNVAQNKILASFSESRKEGSRSKEEAERRAVRTLAGKISSEVGSKIDATMRGK